MRRCRSATARPTPSPRPCGTCSACWTCARGSGCSTSAPAPAGPPRCWPTSSAPPGTGGGRAEIRQARTGVLGAPEDGPFDRILVSAAARRRPPALLDQLADGGVLVLPVRERMLRIRRRGAELEETDHGAYLFVPLIEED